MEVKYLRGHKLLIDGSLREGVIEIREGRIHQIHPYSHPIPEASGILLDAGEKVVMSGLVDSHVHVNEPGRTEWEGYWTATRAAAAGGVTTIIDMPLNSIPPTTTVANLETKIAATCGKCHVDVGFWGGVVPNNKSELRGLVNSGVIGFKCFLIPSGVDEFPCVCEAEVDAALSELTGSQSLLAFHAEVETNESDEDRTLQSDPAVYETFLKSRPSSMESNAIQMVTRLSHKHKNVRVHVVHLSAADALPIIANAKTHGLPLTVETCPHYLTLSPTEIGSCRTEYKCCPPIRNLENQDALWEGLRSGIIDMIVSDHSPCTVDLKRPGEQDFMSAWGGIASVQFGLSIIWTEASKRGFGLGDIHKWMSQKTAELSGFGSRKGQIAAGYDADIVIWDPEAEVKVEEDIIQHRNKVTPYKGKKLKGRIHQTILRGHVIFDEGTFTTPQGHLIFPNKC